MDDVQHHEAVNCCMASKIKQTTKRIILYYDTAVKIYLKYSHSFDPNDSDVMTIQIEICSACCSEMVNEK